MSALRRALWEIFGIGIVVSVILIAVAGAHGMGTTISCLICGPLFALPVWGIYRLGRFMVIGH